MNILDYIDWRGDLTFEKSEFNDVDALILSQLSYLNFDGLLQSGNFFKKIKLSCLAENFKNSPDFEKRSDMGMLINKLTVELFFKAATSARFCDVDVFGYTSLVNFENAEQFSAVVFGLEKDKNFVAFRGTDDTIVGWKEDFNLATMDAVPAQKDALQYFEDVASVVRGELLLGGHSKGGNLAVYAAANADAKIKKRISTIYNMDGPGFSAEKIQSNDFYEVNEKVASFYPRCSIIGMMFHHAGEIHVIESDEFGLMQHDPFSWHIVGRNFVLLQDFDKASSFFHDTFNTWVSSLDKNQRETLVETLFDIIQSTNAKTNSEIEKNLLQNSVRIIKAFNSLDKNSRDTLFQTVKQLFRVANKKLPDFLKEIAEK